MRNILTFDVEDWYQGLDVARTRWSRFERRLTVGLEFILDALAACEVRATFFVLGVTAYEHPEWVRRIADEGHEVATHGWSHTPIYRQTPCEFRDELRRSLDVLQSITGERVRGHRAAFFSITTRSLWALDELAAQGLRYDASIYPVHNYRYGMPRAHRFPYRLSQPLWELPISTWRVGRVNVPMGGGFYLRFWHYRLVQWAIKRLNAQGQPAVMYFHPWEFDAAQPRLRGEARWLARATHYYRLGSTRETLRRLLHDFEWT
ncbi:MAG: polysaccharide deacetylase family protein, partial [Chloroflexi bacterium]|nr:polysaccharide deacetylase family protein [Chloroflexota bacterium]